MPPEIQTSFIPKQPAPAPLAESASKARSFSIVNFLAVIIFLGTLAAGAGLYFYKAAVESNISSMTASLERSRAAFEPGLISDLQILDKRLSASREILGNHITVSPIFSSLEALTLKSVRFNKFSFKMPEEAGEKIQVSATGETSAQGGYRSIALQSNKLAENKYFKDIIFSNLALTQTGGVSFDLTLTVDPNFLLFEKNITNL